MMFKKIVLLLIIGFAAQNKAHSNHQNNLSNHLTATCKHLFDQGYSREQIAQIVSKKLSIHDCAAKTKFFNRFKCSKEKVISFAIGASIGVALVALGSSCLYACTNSTKAEDTIDSQTIDLMTERTELEQKQAEIKENFQAISSNKEVLLTTRKELVTLKKDAEKQSTAIKQQLDQDCTQLIEIDKKITKLLSNKKSTESLITETNENLVKGINEANSQVLDLLNQQLAIQKKDLAQISSKLTDNQTQQHNLQESITSNSKEFGCLKESIVNCDSALKKLEEVEHVLNNSLDELNNAQLLNTKAIEKINNTLKNPDSVIDEL